MDDRIKDIYIILLANKRWIKKNSSSGYVVDNDSSVEVHLKWTAQATGFVAAMVYQSAPEKRKKAKLIVLEK